MLKEMKGQVTGETLKLSYSWRKGDASCPSNKYTTWTTNIPATSFSALPYFGSYHSPIESPSLLSLA